MADQTLQTLSSPKKLLEERLGFAVQRHLKTIRNRVRKFAKDVKEISLSNNDIEADLFLEQNAREFIIWLSGTSINKKTWSLYKNYLKNHFGIDSRHFQGVSNNNPSKPAYELAVITEKELLKIIPLIENIRDRALLSFLYGTGGRRVGEARFVRWSDVAVVKDGSFSFLITKTKTSGKTFKKLSPESPLYKYFSEYWRANKESQKTGKPLFPSYHKNNFGNFLSSNGLNDLVSKLIGRPTHGIRRGFISDSSENGDSLEEISLKTGHQRLSMVYHYLRLANEKKLADEYEEAQNLKEDLNV